MAVLGAGRRKRVALSTVASMNRCEHEMRKLLAGRPVRNSAATPAHRPTRPSALTPGALDTIVSDH